MLLGNSTACESKVVDEQKVFFYYGIAKLTGKTYFLIQCK